MVLSAQLVVLAAAEAEERSGLSAILPDMAELVWGAVGFTILFVALSKFAFPKLGQMLDQRAALIQGQIDEAEGQRVAAEQLRVQYEAQLTDARGTANGIVEEARAQAERLRADIVAKAEEEAALILAKAREDAEAERGRLVSELRGQVATISVELAGKIVQKELDANQHRALVDQYINELSGLN
jgi:F-type H+-transporting ATPase subunit b